MCFVDFQLNSSIVNSDDNYLTEISGDISISTNKYRSLKIGYIEAYYFYVSEMVDNNFDPFEIFDSIDGETANCYEYLYDDETHFFNKDVLRKYNEDVIEYNFLLLRRLAITKKYRGNGIGLAAIHKTIMKFRSGCGLIGLIPGPLQFLDKINEKFERFICRKSLPSNKIESEKKLSRYYERLGFEKFNETDIFIFNPIFKLPKIEELGYKCICQINL